MWLELSERTTHSRDLSREDETLARASGVESSPSRVSKTFLPTLDCWTLVRTQ